MRRELGESTALHRESALSALQSSSMTGKERMRLLKKEEGMNKLLATKFSAFANSCVLDRR